MPKIQPYSSPQIDARVQPEEGLGNLRYAGSFSGAAREIGGAITQAGDRAYERQAQEETITKNADFAEAQEAFREKVDAGVQDGTIDPDKIAGEVQETINGLNTDISTDHGRRTFERNAARLKTHTAKMATKGRAMVAGVQAVNGAETAMRSYGSTVRSNPSMFGDTLQSAYDTIDDMVVTQGLKETDAAVLRKKVGGDLAESALTGWAKQNPDMAQQFLNTKEYGDHFTPEKYRTMQGYINGQKSAKLTEVKRQEAYKRKTEKANADAFMAQNIERLYKGEMSTQEVFESDLPWKQKGALLDKMEKLADGGGYTDPAVTNDIRRRILLPEGHRDKINHVEQIMYTPGIQMDGIEKTIKWLDKSPEARAVQSGERDLLELATKSLSQKNQMSLSGGGSSMDEYSKYNLDRFMEDYQSARKDAISQGKNPRDLLNPNSKEYFGLNLSRYKLTPTETLKIQADLRRKQTEVKTLMTPAPEKPGAPPPPAPAKKIRVISPQGQAGTIDESEKDFYLKEKGFRLGQ